MFVPAPRALGPGQVSLGARGPGTPQEDPGSHITDTQREYVIVIVVIVIVVVVVDATR